MKPDLGVVRIGQAECAEVRQIASHRDVSGRLSQGQAEHLLEQHLVELVGERSRLRRIQFADGLFDLCVDLRAADLSEVALRARAVDLGQARQWECVTAPGELGDVEVTDRDVVGEEALPPA